MDEISTKVPGGTEFTPSPDSSEGSRYWEAVDDDLYLEACHVSSLLNELGMEGLGPAAGLRVHRAAGRLVTAYEAARCALDRGKPGAVRQLGKARRQLRDAAVASLVDFPLSSWQPRDGFQP